MIRSGGGQWSTGIEEVRKWLKGVQDLRKMKRRDDCPILGVGKSQRKKAQSAKMRKVGERKEGKSGQS